MQTDNKLKNQSGVCLHPFSFHYINKCLQLQESNFRMRLGVVMRMHNQIISEGLHQSHFEVGWRFEVAGSILRSLSGAQNIESVCIYQMKCCSEIIKCSQMVVK